MDFILHKKIWKLKKAGEDFFPQTNKQIWKFKKGWEKIGLWIPLNDFFFK